jgi:hypothetical protein
MFWKKKEKIDFPTETLSYDEYYIVSFDELQHLNELNVKFDGKLTEKPVVEFYVAGWPWSVSSRLIEEDHGHRTLLKMDDIVVYFKGPLHLIKGETVTIWGKLKDKVVQAKRIESQTVIYQS